MPDTELLGLLKITCKVLDQEMCRNLTCWQKEASGTQENISNNTRTSNIGTNNNCINILDYFRSSAKKEAEKRASTLLTMKKHNDFSDLFTCFGCFEGTFKLQVQKGSCPFQTPPRRVAYALQEPLWKELERLQRQQVIIPLDADETSEWCNSFVLLCNYIAIT